MNIFIGCSSREEINDIYKDSAIKLAEFLSNDNHNLVCGGTDGLMGILAGIFKENNRNIIKLGVNGYFSVDDKEVNSFNYNSVGERKSALIKKADMIIFLPGGLGTLDEMFTMIESKRAKEHNLPIIIININNYYDGIIKQLNEIYKGKFASNSDKDNYFIINKVNDIKKYV